MSAASILLTTQIAVIVLLFVSLFIAVYTLLLVWLPRRTPLPLQRLREALAKQKRYRFLRSLLLVPRRESQLDELRSLFTACGIQSDAAVYEACKRLILFLCSLVLVHGSALWLAKADTPPLVIWLSVFSLVAIVLFSFDKALLRTLREHRRARIVQDVQVISSQLLYYKDSRLNLHVQLLRCLPLAGYIRKEMQLLVNEWYEGSHEALQRFRKRLSTDEADDFAETLHVLHLHDSKDYYDLLQERIRNYKEKLALIRDGRKEAASYMLFLLAGIPILYTFIIFIYPWVAEARYLFGTLG